MTEKQDVLARMPRTEAGRDMLAHSVQYVPADADKRITGAKIADIEDEAAALVRTPETLDAGTTTDCPLEGVHEHAFRGPHRFHEWDPSSYFTLNDRPPVRTPETLDVAVDRVVEALFNEGLLRDDQNDATYHRRVGEVVARAAIAGASR